MMLVLFSIIEIISELFNLYDDEEAEDGQQQRGKSKGKGQPQVDMDQSNREDFMRAALK